MQDQIARTWWGIRYRNYRNYLIESNPFNKKSKARTTEWEAIYNGFNINPTRYPKLVDFGCGGGHFVLNFLKKGFEVTGIDLSDEALRILKKRAHKYKLSKKLHLLNNGLYTPIRELEGKFDAGCMIVTYHCISNKKEEQKKVFKNFTRLIRKNGKVLIMEPNPLNPLYYLFYLFVYKKNLQEGFSIINSRKEILVNLLKETGMSDMEISYHSFLCKIPGIRNFSAFHIITAIKK